MTQRTESPAPLAVLIKSPFPRDVTSPVIDLKAPLATAGGCVVGVLSLPAQVLASSFSSPASSSSLRPAASPASGLDLGNSNFQISLCVQGTWRLDLGKKNRERGTIWQSEPLYVFPDQSGEPSSYDFSIPLPADLVPSFRKGLRIYCSYAVVVRFQEKTLQTITDESPAADVHQRGEAAIDSTSRMIRAVFQLVSPQTLCNPLRINDYEDRLASSLSLLAEAPRYDLSKKPCAFRLGFAQKHLAFLRFDRNWFELGNEVTGSLDFSDAEITCFQVSCFLVVVERVLSSTGGELLTETKLPVAEQHTHAEQLLFAPVSIAVPRDCPNEFTCERASISYIILFEFVIMDGRGGAQKFSWDCPVHILSPAAS